MTIEPVLMFLLPVTAALAIWLARLEYRAARGLTLVTSIILLLTSVRLLVLADGTDRWVHYVGNWPAPFGITWVVDRLAALFAFIQSLLLVAATGMLRSETHGETTALRAYPLLLVLAFGLMGAVFTADIFNLFVMFEVVLITSYLLIQVPGTPRSLKAGFPNVVINVIAAAFFFAGVGILYGIGGSVNMADLAIRVPDADPFLRLAGAGMVMTAFVIKAGVLPVTVFWLPATYPTFSGPVAAFFGGMLTKLGIYALIRTAPILLVPTGLNSVLLWLGGATALIGVLMAFAQYELRRLLSFHIVSQVGYMAAALSLLTPAGIAAAIFFALHNILVKSALYFTADELERANGTRDLREMRWYRGGTGVAFIFCVAAFSIAGIPPLSGFFGKLSVFKAVWDETAVGPLALLVTASFFTLASMVKIWQFCFQQVPEVRCPAGFEDDRSPARLMPLLLVTAVSLAMGAGAGWMSRYSLDAARQVLDTKGAVKEIIRPEMAIMPEPKEPH